MGLVKKAAFVGIVGVLMYSIYEPMPAGIADYTSLWLSAKLRRIVRFINRLRGRSEFEMDLLALFLTPPDYNDPDMTVFDDYSGPTKLRVYYPATRTTKGPAIIFVHGGGFVLGDTLSYDFTVFTIAKQLNMTFFSVEYRKAPKFVFPTQVLDTEAAVLHVIANAAKFGVDPGRIGIMGDSAGGSLAATIAIKLRPENPRLPHPLALQVLLYPALQSINLKLPSFQVPVCRAMFCAADAAKFLSIYHTGTDIYAERLVQNLHTSPKTKEQVRDKVFSTTAIPKELIRPDFIEPDMDVGTDMEEFRNVNHWMGSPLILDDLSRLPPAYIIACEHDILRDDSFIYTDRLNAAGVPATLKYYPHAYHGIVWMSKSKPRSDLAAFIVQEMMQFIKETL